jgi:probable O-glycosylation ligase (exosortase A-associated)
MTYVGLLLFFFFEYVRPTSYVPALAVLRLNTLIPAAVLLGTIVTKGHVPSRDVWREANTRLILALLVLICVSIVIADVTLYAFNVLKLVGGYALITWVIAKQVADDRRLRGVLRVLILAHVVVAALTPEVFTDTEGRHYLASGSFLGDGNDFGLSLNIVIPFCLLLVFEARRLPVRLAFMGLLLFLVVCVVLTKSRGATVALACVLVYYWLISNRKLLSGALVAMVAAFAIAVAPATYFERMNRIDPSEGSARGRILAWEAGMRMAIDHPLTGVGAGHFGVKYGVDYRPTTGEQVPWQTAHSIYFLVLGELGFPGLFVLLGFIVSNLVANRRLSLAVRARTDLLMVQDRRVLDSLSASLVAFAVNGAFLSAAYYPHLYVLGGLHMAARRIIRGRTVTADPDGTGLSPIGVEGGTADRPGSELPAPSGSSQAGGFEVGR